MADIKATEALVVEEHYMGHQGLMVRCDDQAMAIHAAEICAQMRGRTLQDIAAQVVIRNDRKHYFFPYKP